jgi:hypothetical protein
VSSDWGSTWFVSRARLSRSHPSESHARSSICFVRTPLPALPSQRGFVNLIGFSSTLILGFGGKDSSGNDISTIKSEDYGISWSTVEQTTPDFCYGAGAIAVNGSIWVVGMGGTHRWNSIGTFARSFFVNCIVDFDWFCCLRMIRFAFDLCLRLHLRFDARHTRHPRVRPTSIVPIVSLSIQHLHTNSAGYDRTTMYTKGSACNNASIASEYSGRHPFSHT